MSVPHHDGLLVYIVDDGPDEEIDGIDADFAMRLKEVTMATLDRAREVKQLSESVQKVNDRQTCFESVLNLDPGPTEDQNIDFMPLRRTTQLMMMEGQRWTLLCPD